MTPREAQGFSEINGLVRDFQATCLVRQIGRQGLRKELKCKISMS